MSENSIPGLTPTERKHWPLGDRVLHHFDFPPALGSLEQRLTILARRHGARVQTPRATSAERREYSRWLRENDPTATDPYAAARKDGA